MTETEKQTDQQEEIKNPTMQQQEEEDLSAAGGASSLTKPLLLALSLALALFVGFQFYGPLQSSLFPVTSGSPVGVMARLDDLEARTKRAEEKLASLAVASVNATALQNATGSTENTGNTANTGNTNEVEQLKIGLAGLSGALSLLQGELEKSSKVTNEERLNTQAGLATIVAYLQMQRAVMSGSPFEKERQTMRRLADSDQVFVDLLMKLEAHALQGASTLPALTKDWRVKAAEAQTALREAVAKTWMDRVLVALEGLVSIRSLNPQAGESQTFAAITVDLDNGRLADSVQKVAALPANVQALLADWQAKARARLETEALLDSITAHLIERGSPPAQTVEPAPQIEGGTP